MADIKAVAAPAPALPHQQEITLPDPSGADSPMPDNNSDLGSHSDFDGPVVELTVHHRNQSETRRFYEDATLDDLASAVQDENGIPKTHQKFLVSGLGLLRPALDADRARLLATLQNRKVTLIGTPPAELQRFLSMEQRAAERQAARRIYGRQQAHQQRRRRSPQDLSSAQYVFEKVEPLPNLPDPARSRALLERLANDRGIRAAMRRHRLRVGLLTEMEPLSNTQTTHEGTTRLLGLNRNAGQVIELRLWTDAYDGFRDYNTIRKTLCHELAHNRHGPHDRDFWDFCHVIEREVHEATTGRTAGGDGGFAPSREDEAHDEGGWTGGEFVLGSGTARVDTSALSRREILARAAEERRRRMDEDEHPSGGSRGSTP